MTTQKQLPSILQAIKIDNATAEEVLALQIRTALERTRDFRKKSVIKIQIDISPVDESETMIKTELSSSVSYPKRTGQTLETIGKAESKTTGWTTVDGVFSTMQPTQEEVFAALPDNVAAMPRAKAN